MTKLQPYYYEDVVFQLDLNLQTIRRELIKLVEDSKLFDCLSCNNRKCCCSSLSSCQSTTMTIASSDSACEVRKICAFLPSEYTAAPSAKTLPAPKWPESNKSNGDGTMTASHKAIKAWVKACLPHTSLPYATLHFPLPCRLMEDVNYSWPPIPRSIWSKETLLETIQREHVFYSDIVRYERRNKSNNSVEAFFKCFSNGGFHKSSFNP